MGLRINSVRDAEIEFDVTLERAGAVVNALESKRRCIAKLRSLTSDGFTSVQEAYDIVNTRLEADVARLRKAAIAKSETDATSSGYSKDYFVFEPGDENRMTASQVLESEDRARTIANVQAIRDAVASMGSNFDESATGINVRIDDYSGDQRVTVNSTTAQAAASVGSQDDLVWPAMDLADPKQWADADVLNAQRTGFSGSLPGPATRANGAAGDNPTNFSKAAFDRAQRRSERRDRDR